jgi:hypothetical protein
VSALAQEMEQVRLRMHFTALRLAALAAVKKGGR